MIFSNRSIEKLNEANKLVEEFKVYALERARLFIELNEWDEKLRLPSVETLFSPGTSVWIETEAIDKFLNSTNDAALKVSYRNDEKPFTRQFFVPSGYFFGEK